MRQFLLYLTLFVILTGHAVAQQKIDSLENELQKNIPDTTRVQILLSLSDEYQYSSFAKSRQYAEEAIKLSEEKGLRKERAVAYSAIGYLYALSGDYGTALRYDNMALQISLVEKDSVRISRNYSAIANDYYDLGDYDEAYYYFTQSYRVARLIPDSLRITIALHNIGRVYKELGQFDRALEHMKTALRMSERISDEEGLPYTLHEIGDLKLRKGEYDSALQTLMQSLREVRRQDIKVLEPRVLTKIATIYLHKDDYKNASAYYDTTFSLHERTNNKFGIGEVELGRGLAFMRQGRHDQALDFINRSLAMAKEVNARTLESSCYTHLSALWEKKGDYKRALDYYKQYKALEDTLFSQDTQEKLLQDQLRFETEAKDTQIAVLSRDKDATEDQLKRQEFIRNILVVVIALSVILLATVYRSGQRRRQINMLLLRHQEEMEKRSEELEKLNQVKDKFFSIISHDLRSPINALSGLLDLLDKGAVRPDELPKHIHELKTRFNHTRTLLNNLLDWTLLQMDKLNIQPAKISLHKIVEDNIQLLSSVNIKQIRMRNEVPSTAMVFVDSNTINLVIRNLMTNAIKFTNDGGEVLIAALDKTTEWMVSVQDNGVGINNDVMKILFDKTAPYTTRGTANEKGTGLGLILCKEFVEKNGGKIWVESEVGKGSTFYFTLPKANN